MLDTAISCYSANADLILLNQIAGFRTLQSFSGRVAACILLGLSRVPVSIRIGRGKPSAKLEYLQKTRLKIFGPYDQEVDRRELSFVVSHL